MEFWQESTYFFTLKEKVPTSDCNKKDQLRLRGEEEINYVCGSKNRPILWATSNGDQVCSIQDMIKFSITNFVKWSDQ